uniref:Uncharacterized protein n=1 Tax=Parascaris equorum TaxID=6256 RepID=A0A914RT80_PAREQ
MKINSAEEKAVSLYASCIDEERLRELGVRPWLAFVESIGGWAPHERYLSLKAIITVEWNSHSSALIELVVVAWINE